MCCKKKIHSLVAPKHANCPQCCVSPVGCGEEAFLATFLTLHPHHTHLWFLWTPPPQGPLVSDPSFLRGRAAIMLTGPLIQGELLSTQLSPQVWFSCLTFTLSTAPRVSIDMFLGMHYNGTANGHSLHNFIKIFIKSEIKTVLSKGLCYMKVGTQLK